METLRPDIMVTIPCKRLSTRHILLYKIICYRKSKRNAWLWLQIAGEMRDDISATLARDEREDPTMPDLSDSTSIESVAQISDTSSDSLLSTTSTGRLLRASRINKLQ